MTKFKNFILRLHDFILKHSIFLVICLIFIIIMTFIDRQSAPERQEKIEMLQRTCESIPNYPDFIEYGRDSSIKNSNGLYKIFYQSKASQEQIKDYFYPILIKEGWQLFSEENYSFHFTKGDNGFSIYMEESPWQYSKNCSWGLNY